MMHSTSQAQTAPERNRRAILTFSGALTHENCSEMERSISDEIRQKRSEVILDLNHVPFMDSAVVELLVDVSEQMESRGGKLKIIRLQDICRDILLVTRTLQSLQVYKDLHAAITDAR
ncbi:MAG: STAS domain-containing protein [Desulfobacteraceae bacterium]|jgi:anti-anti-sigma factor